MKKLLLITFLTLLPVQAWAQNDAVADRAAAVRTFVSGLSERKTTVALLTRRLIPMKGKFLRSRADSFDVRVARVVNTIPYSYILEMKAGAAEISFVPDIATRNHGGWEDVGRIFPGTRILVVYTDGKSAKGFSNSVSQTHLIMIDEKGRQRVDTPREKIVAVYGLLNGYGGVKKGASKGAEGMTAGNNQLLDGVFAGIGALVGLVKSDGRPILIYSK